jgi:hypothetical protein
MGAKKNASISNFMGNVIKFLKILLYRTIKKKLYKIIYRIILFYGVAKYITFK